MVSCQDDGTVSWLVEVYVQGPIDGCAAPVDVDPSEVLLVGIDEWDGESGTYEIGNGAAVAVYGVEPLTGTFTLEVSAAYEPSAFDYDFTGASADLAGSIHLETCSFVDEMPCAAATTE